MANTSIEMTTLCPHIFISKSLLKSLPAYFDIINRTLDIFRNRDFSEVANYHGYTEKGPLKNNLTYIYDGLSDLGSISRQLKKTSIMHLKLGI